MKLLIFLFISINCFAMTTKMKVDEKLRPYIKHWDVENFIIHMNNHINNNILMFEEVFDNYLVYGIPENKAMGKRAVSAKDLRNALGIPEDVWANLETRVQLRNRLHKFLTLHDAGKVDTTTDFLKDQNSYLTTRESFVTDQGKRKSKKLIIEQLNDGFGKDFSTSGIQTDNSLKAMKKQGQETVELLNKVDDHVGRAYLANKSNLPPMLQGDWLDEVAFKIEKLVDSTERWGNKVSPVEFNKIMARGSEYTFRKGVAVARTDIDSPSSLLQYHLEDNYSKLTNHYDDAHKSYRSFFKSLNDIGIDHHNLHPIRKYELIPLVQNGRRSLNFPDLEKIKEILYVDKFDNFKEVVKKNTKSAKMLADMQRKRRVVFYPRKISASRVESTKISRALKQATGVKCFEASLLKALAN